MPGERLLYALGQLYRLLGKTNRDAGGAGVCSMRESDYDYSVMPGLVLNRNELSRGICASSGPSLRTLSNSAPSGVPTC